MQDSLVFLSGKRTPFGANGGSLKNLHPTELSVQAGQAALEQAKVSPESVEHVVLGNVLASASDSIYTPRHFGLKLGVPQSVPALGINRLCGSGFQVVVEAYHQFLAGDSSLALVGGVENMSMAPYLLHGARWGYRMGDQKIRDMLMAGLTDSYPNLPMAVTAENLAQQYNITREEADEYAVRSQARAAQAQKEGRFRDELIALEYQDAKKRAQTLEADEHVRPEATVDSLAKLRPVFQKEGMVTAGNASGIVDGAAVMTVASEKRAQREGFEPLGRMIAYGVVGCDPKIMGIGPAPAAREALKRAGMGLGDMDLIEVNEAFAPQTLAVERELEIPREKFNVNGGAIALGHPLAASGTRITMHALYELRRQKKKYGLVSACIGGGQGMALVIEAF